ncbi:MAG: hypothetical protein ABW019_02505 [Chitinophagaceae bacterium]
MTPYSLHPSFYNQPIRLRPEEAAAPQQVLQEFFEVFPLADTRRLLWLAVEAALSQPHSIFDNAAERQSLLWLYHQLERVLEAGMLVGQAGDSSSVADETQPPQPTNLAIDKKPYHRRSKNPATVPAGYYESLARSRCW